MNITIKNADKGTSILVQDTDVYIKEGLELLTASVFITASLSLMCHHSPSMEFNWTKDTHRLLSLEFQGKQVSSLPSEPP